MSDGQKDFLISIGLVIIFLSLLFGAVFSFKPICDYYEIDPEKAVGSIGGLAFLLLLVFAASSDREP